MTSERSYEDLLARQLWDASEGGTLSVARMAGPVEVQLLARETFLILSAEEHGRVLGRARLTGTEVDTAGRIAHHLTEFMKRR